MATLNISIPESMREWIAANPLLGVDASNVRAGYRRDGCTVQFCGR